MAIQAGREPPITGDSDKTTVIDGRRSLIIPGLVNTHHHLYQSLTRCMPSVQTACLFDWLTTLYPRLRELSYETLRQAATISIAELLLSGCTTTSDHHYVFPAGRDVKIEAVLEAAEALGIRIHACRGSMSLGQSAGGLPPDACVQTEEDILADCQRVQRCRLQHSGGASPKRSTTTPSATTTPEASGRRERALDACDGWQREDRAFRIS